MRIMRTVNTFMSFAPACRVQGRKVLQEAFFLLGSVFLGVLIATEEVRKGDVVKIGQVIDQVERDFPGSVFVAGVGSLADVELFGDVSLGISMF